MEASLQIFETIFANFNRGKTNMLDFHSSDSVKLEKYNFMNKNKK